MSSPLEKFQGRPWSEIVVRQKLNANEILLSKDRSYDLLRCRHCKRVVKCGYVDIHEKKCAQHRSKQPPKNTSSSKITLAKYYYDILPIDNSTNPYCSTIPEPPHKKRKVNKNNDNEIEIIPPPSMRNNNRNKRRTPSIYNDLYYGLKPRKEPVNTKKQRTKSIKKKLKLRLNRPSKSAHNTEQKNTKDNTSSLDLMRDQKRRNTLTLTSAWEREEDIITEQIKAECSINYVTYHQFWNQYAKALDKYAVECTTRSNTQRIKVLDQQISRYNSHQFRPVIKHLLEKNHYKEGGREFEDYQALHELVGISYNIPHIFSNGICPPQGKSLSLRAFVDEGKYQSCLQREEQDFWFKSQPLSPLRYISAELHNKYVKMQQKMWATRQLQQQIQRQKQHEIKKKKKKQQQQSYMTIPLINKNTNQYLYRNVPNISYQQRPIAINRNRYNGHTPYVPSPFVNTGSAGPPPSNMRNIRSYRSNRGSQTPRPLIRAPSYDNYNASPSDTAITALSAATYPNTASSQPPIPLNTHINTNINNNPSPQSINSNHTSYTTISQHSATPMAYSNSNSNNNSSSNSNRMYSIPPNGLQRGNTNEAEMFMPSIGSIGC